MIRKVLTSSTTFIFLLFAFARCAYNDISVKTDCTTSTLAIKLTSSNNVTGCKSINGSLIVEAQGGTEPYDFNINGGSYQTNPEFTDLGAGTYTVNVKDKDQCERSLQVIIKSADSNLAANATSTPDNQCNTDNGTVTVSATGGQSPYTYQIDAKGYFSASTFSELKSGQHVVVVKDAAGCQTTVSVQVERGSTGTSYAGDIKVILDTNCNLSGCHGAGTGARDWTNLNNIKNNSGNIKTRTTNKTMPPGNPLSQSEIQKIACWVDDGAPTNN